MIRLLTAAAMAALLSTPVMAQSVSPSNQGATQWQQEQGNVAPGTSSSESMSGMSGSQGLSGQQSQGLSEQPTDCGPQDPRPECQTAQLPTPEGAQDQELLQQRQPGYTGQTGAGDAPAEMPADDSRLQDVGPGSESGAPR